jgi:hypothetical protein
MDRRRAPRDCIGTAEDKEIRERHSVVAKWFNLELNFCKITFALGNMGDLGLNAGRDSRAHGMVRFTGV